MTEHKILPLRCPSCGGAASQPSREMAFGAEFSCDHCGVTSVLIIDRALVALGALEQQGGKVCVVCGRIAPREARFCQAGHELIRRCIYCNREFPVEHQRCDFCGKMQSAWEAEAKALLAAGDKMAASIVVQRVLKVGRREAWDIVETWPNGMSTSEQAEKARRQETKCVFCGDWRAQPIQCSKCGRWFCYSHGRLGREGRTADGQLVMREEGAVPDRCQDHPIENDPPSSKGFSWFRK